MAVSGTAQDLFPSKELGRPVRAGRFSAVQKWLAEGKPSPTGRRTFATYRVWKKDSPLQESGLLGPVRLLNARQITLGKQ